MSFWCFLSTLTQYIGVKIATFNTWEALSNKAVLLFNPVDKTCQDIASHVHSTELMQYHQHDALVDSSVSFTRPQPGSRSKGAARKILSQCAKLSKKTVGSHTASNWKSSSYGTTAFPLVLLPSGLCNATLQLLTLVT